MDDNQTLTAQPEEELKIAENHLRLSVQYVGVAGIVWMGKMRLADSAAIDLGRAFKYPAVASDRAARLTDREHRD